MGTIRWAAAAALAGSVLLGACGDGGGDLVATCERMAAIEGPDDITVERLDDLLAVAPEEVEDDIRLVRDRLAADGEAAFEAEEVGAAFERIGAFEEREC